MAKSTRSGCARGARLQVSPLTAAAIAISAAAAVLLIWRILAWPLYVNTDSWAYTALGRDLISMGHVNYDDVRTAPKPLATVLGAVANAASVDRGFQVIVGLALALLLGALFLAGVKQGGYVAGFFAVAAFAATPGFERAVVASYIDVVTAALVVLAVVARNRLRLSFLVVAGLLRPEAWLVTGVVTAIQSHGTLLRRLVLGLVVGGLAPAIWLVFDAIFAGDLQAAVHSRKGGLGGWHGTVFSAAYAVAKSLGVEGGVVVMSLGLVGLAGRYLGASRRPLDQDLLPVTLVIVWSATLALEYFRDLARPTDRYMLPVVATLALEAAVLVGRFRPVRDPRAAGISALLAAAFLALVVLNVNPSADARERAKDHDRIRRSLPEIEHVLACGRLAIAGHGRIKRIVEQRSVASFIPELATVSRHALDEFDGLDDHRSAYAGVLEIYGKGNLFPDWRTEELPIGRLSVSPRCLVERTTAGPGEVVVGVPLA